MLWDKPWLSANNSNNNLQAKPTSFISKLEYTERFRKPYQSFLPRINSF